MPIGVAEAYLMEKDMKRILLALIATGIATSAMAGIGDIQSGGGTGPLKVKSAMVAIKSPSGVCPAQAKLKAWIYTNKAGPVAYMMIKHGEGASVPQVVNTKKVNGLYVAEISQTMVVDNAIDTQFRIAAKGVGNYTLSNWAPLKANCV
jgi:hypothetical protein